MYKRQLSVGALPERRPEAPEGALEGTAPLDGPYTLQFRHLAVREMPGSGKPQEQLEAAGINARHIVQAIRELVAG